MSWVIPDGAASDHAQQRRQRPLLGRLHRQRHRQQSVLGRTPPSSLPGTIGEAGTITSPPKSSTTASAGDRAMSTASACRLIVVSPYAKASLHFPHHARLRQHPANSSRTHFNLPSLGYADAYADDLSDCFDFNQTPLPFHTIQRATQCRPSSSTTSARPPIPMTTRKAETEPTSKGSKSISHAHL